MLDLLLLLRIAQAVFALVVLALSSYVAQWYDSETLTPSPSQFNFLLYTSLGSLLSIAYLHFMPMKFPRLAHPFLAVLVEFGNFIFYMGGFIALALFLHDLKFCRGSVCMAARADATFAGFNTLAWLFTTFQLGRQILRRRATPRSRYAPEMANV